MTNEPKCPHCNYGNIKIASTNDKCGFIYQACCDTCGSRWPTERGRKEAAAWVKQGATDES